MGILQGKRILVTGAASGIGHGAARAFERFGARASFGLVETVDFSKKPFALTVDGGYTAH